MAEEPKTPKTLEQLETEIVSLKIRLKRVENFIRDIPNPTDYVPNQTDDELLEEATKIVQEYDRASASLLQRRLEIGYARAAGLMDLLEANGIVGPSDGSSRPREVLPKKDEPELE